MTNEEAYDGIVQTCRRCQEMMDTLVQSVGTEQGMRESGPHLQFWREYEGRLTGPVRIAGADFRALLFRNHWFRDHSFVKCDFSGSRWILAGIKIADCSGSNFSGIKTMGLDLENVDCSECNFTDAEVRIGFTIDQTRFRGANFTGATLELGNIFNSKAPPDFTGAIMTGCTFINRSRFVRGVPRGWFTSSQLGVMSIGKPDGAPPKPKVRSGCFVAAAACGPGSDEVRILQEYRDKELLSSPLGRAFVRVYYLGAPIVAHTIETSDWLRAAVRFSVVIPAASIARWRLRLKPGGSKGQPASGSSS